VTLATAICIAYAFTCTGFCLGWVACSVLCARPREGDTAPLPPADDALQPEGGS
jgi:hypothetical protein